MSDELDNIEEQNEEFISSEENSEKVTKLGGMFREWFLDYASYVILERAVPHLYDGLKPVQRRILHSMKRLDDGRYNKVANIIGHTMQFHPHGDASIGDALVQIGQKDLLIDMQGNWGNVFTGDRAAASRYIEARLSKFALDVVFNPKTTFWTPSYDGRNKEPIALPVKFPLLLTQGTEGIAVGLSTKILPHNFIELIDACILYLNDKNFTIYPDFITGGYIDVSRYNDGLRGGKIRVRAKIEVVDKKTLSITEIPFGKTTSSLIESIIKANDTGKIKIKKIDDNTAAEVEIIISLLSGTSTDQMIDALYAFTDCEISISPNACVINEDKPQFTGVTEMLKISAENTVQLLKRELEIRKEELEDDWHKSSLEKIFIENRIYHDIEDSPNWEHTISTIDEGLEPFKKLLLREVTTEDIERLTEIKMKRITKHDAFKADEHIKNIEEEIEQINYNLAHIIEFTIDYYKTIKKKYGEGRERKTEIRSFDNIEAAKVVIANEKLYVNRKEGFFGTALKKDEFVGECSDIDDVIIFLKNGKYMVSKVADKKFVGKHILHIGVFRKSDERTVYNLIYRDGKYGNYFMKRFKVTSITRDKEYDITKGTDNSKIIYFTANPNGEAEVIKIQLKPKPKLRRLNLELDFSKLAIKGRNSQGNTLVKTDIHKISLKSKGVSTLGGRNIWFDEAILRLNTDEHGLYLGEFKGGDKILIITKDGKFRFINFDLSNHLENNILYIEKYDRNKNFAIAHYDADQKDFYIKRFHLIPEDKAGLLISENEKSKLLILSTEKYPQFELRFKNKDKDKEPEKIDVEDFIAIKSYKARGNKASSKMVKKIKELTPLEKENSDDSYENDYEGGSDGDTENGKGPLKDITDEDDSQMTLEL